MYFVYSEVAMEAEITTKTTNTTRHTVEGGAETRGAEAGEETEGGEGGAAEEAGAGRTGEGQEEEEASVEEEEIGEAGEEWGARVSQILFADLLQLATKF